MATKIKADLIFQYNVLPVYLDDNTKEDNVLSDFDYTDLMTVLNAKKVGEFDIVLVSLDLVLNRVVIFSELFMSESQQAEEWLFTDFTSEEQTIINNFIALL